MDKLRDEREAMHKHVTKIQALFRAKLERKRDPLGRIRSNRRRVEEIWEALKASDAVLEKEAKLHQTKVRAQMEAQQNAFEQMRMKLAGEETRMGQELEVKRREYLFMQNAEQKAEEDLKRQRLKDEGKAREDLKELKKQLNMSQEEMKKAEARKAEEQARTAELMIRMKEAEELEAKAAKAAEDAETKRERAEADTEAEVAEKEAAEKAKAEAETRVEELKQSEEELKEKVAAEKQKAEELAANQKKLMEELLATQNDLLQKKDELLNTPLRSLPPGAGIMVGTPARNTPYTPQKEEESLLGGTVAVVGEGFKSLFSNLGLGGDATATTPDINRSPGGGSLGRKLAEVDEGEDADAAALDAAAAAVAAAGAGGTSGEEGKASTERAEELKAMITTLEANLLEVRKVCHSCASRPESPSPKGHLTLTLTLTLTLILTFALTLPVTKRPLHRRTLRSVIRSRRRSPLPRTKSGRLRSPRHGRRG